MRGWLNILLLSLSVVAYAGGGRPPDAVGPSESGADGKVLFRFHSGRDMFYMEPGNRSSIHRADSLLDARRADIESGEAIVNIEGFCNSYPTDDENLRAAKVRSNRVKSYFITHSWLKEKYYRTVNHAEAYAGTTTDVVAMMTINLVGKPEPVKTPEPVGMSRPQEETGETPVTDAVEEEPTPVTDAVVVSEIVVDTVVADMPMMAEKRCAVPLSVKSNMLYDVLLMPSLELEYRFDERWSVNVEGTIAWWHDNRRHKYYQIGQVSPEVRYWVGRQGARRGHYVGVFAGGGWYDLENGHRGYKGEGEYYGVSYGYMFPVGGCFAIEAGIGVGFLRTEYEEYLPIDSHYVWQQTSRAHYWGPLKLKLSFVWDIGVWMERNGKGGGR